MSNIIMRLKTIKKEKQKIKDKYTLFNAELSDQYMSLLLEQRYLKSILKKENVKFKFIRIMFDKS